MASQQSTAPLLSRQEMDALLDGHFRAEEAGDLQVIVAGLTPGAEHEVAGRPGGPVAGHDQIAAFYVGLLAGLPITQLEKYAGRYGQDHIVNESILHATARARCLASMAAIGRYASASCMSSISPMG